MEGPSLILVLMSLHHGVERETGYLFKLFVIEFAILCAECGEWYVLDEPRVPRSIVRFGHSAVVHDNRMYIFGGFNGIVLDDMFVYEPGKVFRVTIVVCM